MAKDLAAEDKVLMPPTILSFYYYSLSFVRRSVALFTGLWKACQSR